MLALIICTLHGSLYALGKTSDTIIDLGDRKVGGRPTHTRSMSTCSQTHCPKQPTYSSLKKVALAERSNST